MKPLIIGNQYAQEFEPEYKEQTQPTVIANNQGRAVTPVTVTPVAITPAAVTPTAITPVAVTPIATPHSQVTTTDTSYQRLQASPPPPTPTPYVPPGEYCLLNLYDC